jgi:hypothetical protein
MLAALVAPSRAQPKLADEWLGKPVDDRTFKTFLDFFAYDRQVPFDLRVIDTHEDEGIRKEHLSWQSTPGVRVFANFLQSIGSDIRTQPTLVMLHGAGPLGKDQPGMDRLARSHVRAGYNVMSLDLLYWGERSTDLLVTFSEQEKHEKLYNRPSAYLAWVAQTDVVTTPQGARSVLPRRRIDGSRGRRVVRLFHQAPQFSLHLLKRLTGV